MNKLILILALIFLIGFAGAVTDYHPKDAVIDYKKPCINNGTYCSASAVCNLTMIAPNSSTILANVRMTNQIFYHNYTIPAQSATGTYTLNMMCCDGLCGSETFYIEMTPNGEQPTIPKALFYIGLIFLIIIFFVAILSIFTYRDSPLWKVWWIGIIWIWFIGTTYVCWSMTKDFFTSNLFVVDFFSLLWKVSMYAFPFFFLFAIFYTLYAVYEDKEVQKLINQGFSAEEAVRRRKG